MTQSLLIVTGHPRSGTSMLYAVCNSHPDIFLTYELGNFLRLKKPTHVYQSHIRNRLWPERPHRRLPYADVTHNYVRSFFFVMSYLIVSRYFARVAENNEDALRRTLRTLKPRKKIVGDKYPRYTNMLDEVVGYDDVQRLMIYRDGRDVIASAMEKSQTDWKGLAWADHFSTVQIATEHWLAAIERMERYRERCHIVRYEDIIENPTPVLEAVGDWLGIDGRRFNPRLMNKNSIGRHRERLTADEIAIIEDMAGPTLRRLGYV